MTHQPIRRIPYIRSRRPFRIIHICQIDRPRIIPPERCIVIPIPCQQLLQTVPIFCPLRPIPHHLQNAARRILRVERDPIVRLREAWIAGSVVGRANTDIAPGLLHDNAEDSADIDTRLGRYGFDRFFDVCDLGVAVVELHEAGVGFPEGGIRCPLVLGREVGGRAGVLHVASAAVGASFRTGDFAIAGLVSGCTWEVDDLAYVEVLRHDTGVRGQESVEADRVACRDGAQGVPLFDRIFAHRDKLDRILLERYEKTGCLRMNPVSMWSREIVLCPEISTSTGDATASLYIVLRLCLGVLLRWYSI